jgi:hypothetical protein
MRRLLVVACAALALAVACATGELRGAVYDNGGDAVSAVDSVEALPPAASLQLTPPALSGGVFVDLQFPPSRVTTADVFRPPQA